ncbi:MAG TPA: alpha-(1-_3)-arabinofuranosyltransferase family protein, partial [Candidatus Eremiobacteraceae bacterium]|nr:alpha-(1->3)-arabinofuranosyltransferase family protein [Candidatus Eremiobacteraceae bacterium]
MQRTRSAQALFVWSSMALLALIGLHWAQPPTTVAQIDLAPPYDAANMLGKCASVWNHVHAFIGSVDNCFSWTPHFALQALLQSVLGTSYGQAVIFVLPVMLSWLGAFNCARCLGASPFAAFVTAWAYAFNPARQSMVGVFATGEVCAAVLPWVFYWIVLAAIEPARRRFATAALATASFAVVVILAITPQLLVALVLGSIVWLVFASTLASDRKEFFSWTGRTSIVVIAASLWWIIPNAFSYVGVAITHTADPMSVAWTFARASLINELRFAPMWFWRYPEYNPWSVEFDHNVLFYAAGFVPAAGLAGALLLARGRAVPVARFLALFALVMLFIAKGTHPPLEALNIAFYRIPGMFLFIEPYGAILIAAMCMAIACGIVADILASQAGGFRMRVAGVAAGVTFVGAALCANMATVTGAIFHEQTDPLPNVHIQLPIYWSALAARLNADPAAGGVAILPVDDFYQVDYDWGLHGADLLPVTLLHRAVLMPGAPLTYTQTQEARTVDAAIVSAIATRSANAAQMLRDVGVRFVVARNDVRLSHQF